MSTILRAGFALLALPLVSCQALTGAAPEACEPERFRRAASLPLPPPERPEGEPGKGAPLRFASAIPVNGGIGDVGRWVDVDEQWRAWRLKLRSETARSMSVHIKPLSLPAGGELWVCSPNGRVQSGPVVGLGPADGGQYWSPLVPGPELWIEVLVPRVRSDEVQFTIATAFAGFR